MTAVTVPGVAGVLVILGALLVWFLIVDDELL